MDQENDKKNINLMPEDLRSLEIEHLDKRKVDTSPSLIRPDQSSLKKGKIGPETGSRPSIFSKLKNILPKGKSTDEPVPMTEPILHKNGNGNGNGKFKDINPIVMPQANKPVDGARPAPAVDADLQGIPVRPEINRPPVTLPSKEKMDMPAAIVDEGDDDFSIPEPTAFSAAAASQKPTEKEQSESSPAAEEEQLEKRKAGKKDRFGLKFHQPTGRIRAKFLDTEGVDLIPTAARIRSWQQIGSIIFLTLIGSAIVVAVFYGALFFQEKNILAQQEKREMTLSGLEQQILQFDQINTDIDELGSQIGLINDTLNKHIYWTNFFELLEKYTAQEVHFNGISAGINGGLTLEATAPSYASVARQLKALQQEEAKEFATEVSILSASEGQGGVQFAIVMTLNPDLFYYITPTQAQ